MRETRRFEEALDEHWPRLADGVMYCACGWTSTQSKGVQRPSDEWFDHLVEEGVMVDDRPSDS